MGNEDQLRRREDPNSLPREEMSGGEEEDYAFIRETYKRRPVSPRQVFYIVLGIMAGGCLFGLVAGTVFNRVTGIHTGKTPSTVTIPADEVRENISPTMPADIAEGTADGKGGEDASGQGTNPAAGSEEGEPDTVIIYVTPTPEPELTEEEKLAAALENYSAIHAAFGQLAEDAMKSMVQVTGYKAEEDWFNTTYLDSRTVSGVIIADNSVDLLILAEYRALEGTDRIAATFTDGTTVEAALQKADPTTGFAMFRVPLEDIPAETLDAIEPAVLGNSFTVQPGDLTLVVGRPNGQAGAFNFGNVTSTGGLVPLEDATYNLISTNMYGSSAGSGVLIDTKGRVVGILSASLSAGDPAVLDAVPISLVKSLIERLSNNASLPRTGIFGTDISAATAELYGLPAGVYVTALSEESPAFEAGIRVADIITMVDGKALYSMQAYHERLMEAEPGTTMEVTVERSGSDGMVEYTYTVTVGELA